MDLTIQNDSGILEKRSIAPVLRHMEIDQTEVFPISQMDTVRSAITRRQCFDRTLKFKTQTEDRIIKVTRIQ